MISSFLNELNCMNFNFTSLNPLDLSNCSMEKSDLSIETIDWEAI